MKNTNIYYSNNYLFFAHPPGNLSWRDNLQSVCLGIDRFPRCHKLHAKGPKSWALSEGPGQAGGGGIGSMLLAAPELLLWQLHQVTPPGLGDQVDTCIMSPYPDLPESIYSLVINYHDARMWWYFGCYFCLPVVFSLFCQLATCHVSGGSGSSTKRPEERSPSKNKSFSTLSKSNGSSTARSWL